MNVECKKAVTPEGVELFYTGADLNQGPLPALFYFALSGEESLTLPPYNSPAIYGSDPALRIFSLTLPGHGEGFNKFKAMNYWASEINAGNYPIKKFLDRAVRAIDWLIEEEIAHPNHLAVCGLSRGGLIATHIAAREKRVRTLLGFAPITRLEEVEAFQENTNLESLNRTSLAENLTHLHNVRFYIGNRDRCVGTDACYHFIRHLTEKAHDKRAHHMHVELFITHSIGHKGHGTAPHVFEEGTLWLKNHLIGR